MNKFRVRKADDYKKNFDFLSDNTNICNAAYHLQFLEHCWTNRKTLESTTRSLMNRTIIVELASIVELVLFELLSNANVELVPRKNKKRLEIESNIGLGRLISKAKYYELIEADMTKRLNKLNEGRNSIHFKQFKEKRILEYDYYTDDMVNQAVETFVEFLKAMYSKVRGIKKLDNQFAWPWKA